MIGRIEILRKKDYNGRESNMDVSRNPTNGLNISKI